MKRAIGGAGTTSTPKGRLNKRDREFGEETCQRSAKRRCPTPAKLFRSAIAVLQRLPWGGADVAFGSWFAGNGTHQQYAKQALRRRALQQRFRYRDALPQSVGLITL